MTRNVTCGMSVAYDFLHDKTAHTALSLCQAGLEGFIPPTSLLNPQANPRKPYSSMYVTAKATEAQGHRIVWSNTTVISGQTESSKLRSLHS